MENTGDGHIEVMQGILRSQAMQSIDPGSGRDTAALALAMWLVDPNKGPTAGSSLRAQVRIAQAGSKQISITGFDRFHYAVRSAGVSMHLYNTPGTVATGIWDASGLHESVAAAAKKRGEIFNHAAMRSFDVHPSNLAAVLREWNLPAIDPALVLALVGDRPIARKEGHDVLRSLASPDEVQLDLSEAPFDNEVYLQLVVSGQCSPTLRESLLRRSDDDRCHLMKAAIVAEQVEWVRDLLDHGYRVDRADYYDQREQPIHLAKRSSEITRLLIERGANVHAQRKDGARPLHCGCDGDVMRILVAHGADLYAEDENGHTPLHSAIRMLGKTTARPGLDKFQAVSALIDAGADPFYVPEYHSRDYLTPLQFAVKEGWIDQVEYLMRRCAVDLGQRSVAGRSLVQTAGANKEMKAFLRSAKTGLAIEGSLDAAASEQPGPSSKKSIVAAL